MSRQNGITGIIKARLIVKRFQVNAKVYTVLGLMSGTSLDGVDAAFLETDGERILRFGPGLTLPFEVPERTAISEATQAALAWRFHGPAPEGFALAERAVDKAHIRACNALMQRHPDWAARLDLIGYHGQTILHHPPLTTRLGAARMGSAQAGQTLQLGTGQALATAFSVPVIYDFRTADVAAGGQGAPLAPIYHKALCTMAGLPGISAVLNLGGVGNVTLVSDTALKASDTGPANGPLDSWMQRHGAQYDQGGESALAGNVDFALIERWLARDFFTRGVPRSADRYDFDVLEEMAHLSRQDGAASLAAFTAGSVRKTVSEMNLPPERVIVCGGGRHNPAIMYMLQSELSCPVVTAEDMGWDADMIEAQAFAFLALRSLLGLPISYPETTNAPQPMTGGRLVEP